MEGSLSVVMPNFNHGHLISEALEEILSQSAPPREVVVVDDGSSDESVRVVEAFVRRRPEVRLVRNRENRGVIASVGIGLGLARGEFITFLAADDRVLPGFFERSVRLLRRHPEAGLSTGLCRWTDSSGRDRGIFPSPRPCETEGYLAPDRVLASLRQVGPWFMPGTAVYRRRVVVEAGGYRRELEAYSDVFLCHLVSLRHGACFIPEPLSMWHRTEQGWAWRDSADFDHATRTLEEADRLMRSEFRDLFPADYVDLWKRRWLADLIYHLDLGPEEGRRKIPQLRRFFPSLGLWDRVYFRALGLPGRLPRWATRVYLFSKLRGDRKLGVLARKLGLGGP